MCLVTAFMVCIVEDEGWGQRRGGDDTGDVMYRNSTHSI